MNYKSNIIRYTIKMVLSIAILIFAVSCEDAFDFELPDTGSIADETLPEANFSHTPDPIDFRVLKFSNISSESTKYLWDFGEGVVCDTLTIEVVKDGSTVTEIIDNLPAAQNLSAISTSKFSLDSLKIHGVLKIGTETTSTLKDVSFVRFAAGEGDYDVKLTASDANEESAVKTDIIEVRDVFVPINPEVDNGDMEVGFTPSWKIDAFTGGTTTTVNTSSDGSPIDYNEVDTGSKTKGMKFAAGASNPGNPGSRRYAYQALTVSETTADRTVKYIVEYAYAIKAAATPGSNITVSILDGHFSDGADALASTPLVQSVASDLLGKGNFTVVKKEFTSSASGLISIWISGETDQDAYIDNVKVYPKP